MRKMPFLLVSLAMLSVSLPTVGQPPEPVPGFSSVPISFGPPGARALGIGGAFIAIADDATASEANPAGLIILSRPEVSAHVRQSYYDVQATDINAEFSLDVANIFRSISGVPLLSADTASTFDEPTTSLSFASYVKPFKNWSFSLYYHQNSSFEGADTFSILDGNTIDLYSTINRVASTLESLGASIAFKLGKNLSLGVSVRETNLDLVSLQRFQVDYFLDFEIVTGDLNHTDVIVFDEAFADDDSDLTYNVGLLLNPNGKLSFGLVFKEGGSYTLNRRNRDVLCVNFPLFGFTCDLASGTGNSYVEETVTTPQTFDLPDFLGAGIAWRVTGQFLLALDVNHITYSDLSLPPANRISGITQAIDDELEFHLGAEYTFLPKNANLPISLRAGVFTEEDHDGYVKIDSSQVHFTAGLGIVFKDDIQLDLAGHFSDTVDEAVFSLVYRF